MAQSPTVFFSDVVANGTATVYTAGAKARIDYCTVYNNTNAIVTMSIALASRTMVTKALLPQEAYTFPELINAQLASGSTISITSNTTGPNIQISGYLFS